MSGRSWQVLGALGSGLHAPVVAEQHWAGGVRRVVLARPAPPAARPAAASTSWQVVGPDDRVRLEGQDYSVCRWAGRIDVGCLLDHRPDGLEPGVLAALALEVLQALSEAGCPHGDLDAGAIRLDEHGVYVVGFLGRDGDDPVALAHLIEDWGSAPEALLEAIAASDLGALRESAAPWTDVARLVGQVPDPGLFEHRWTGQTLNESSAPPGPPPKVRAAAIAGLTMVLGWCAAWFYLGGGQ